MVAEGPREAGNFNIATRLVNELAGAKFPYPPPIPAGMLLAWNSRRKLVRAGPHRARNIRIMRRRKMDKTGPRTRAARRGSNVDGPRERAPGRFAIVECLAQTGAPLGLVSLARALDVSDANGHDALKERLDRMERDGQVLRDRRGRYGLVGKMDLVRGRVQGHRDGFGFLIPEEGGDDLFLSPRQMRSLMHRDRIVARVTRVDRFGRKEGALVEILERGTRRVVGRFWRERGVQFVRPDDSRHLHDVLVPREEAANARHGQVVVVEIAEYPTKESHPIGRVVEVLGEHMAPGMEIDVAIRAYDLPVDWTDEVLEEAERLARETPIKPGPRRADLRGLSLVTIDGEDARDFDDAVYCERTPKGWKLLVAIADVSSYVFPGSLLDAEARRRGNSVYFPERVLPMLPEALSNGVCSLRPDEDRLCLACEMVIGGDGSIRRSRFLKGVMRSRARLTYDEVADHLVEGSTLQRRRLGDLAAPLGELYRLYRALRQARDARGAIDFDTVETQIIFGDDGKIARIEPRRRNDAHRLIEECMIGANVAAARFVMRQQMPVLFRIHDGPTPEKLEDLRAFLAAMGVRLAGGNRPEARDYADVVTATADRPDAQVIQTVLLRSLAQAVYSPAGTGHFGLALPAYAHYTSPIRRYPDLQVHRAIKRIIDGPRRSPPPEPPAALIALGEHTSMTERRADEATRDALNALKCEFMLEKVGEEFDGTVTGVVAFGLFVTLDEILVDGLVHVSSLGSDYFHFDPAQLCLKGERTGRTHRLADRIRVRVIRVDMDERKVDFEPSEPDLGVGTDGRGPRRRGHRRVRR